MPIRATPAASWPPLNESPEEKTTGQAQTCRVDGRGQPPEVTSGHAVRAGNLGTDCPSFPIKVGSNQNAPRGPDTLATDMLAHHKGKGHAAQTHHKGEGHAAQTLLSYKPVDSRTLSSDTPVGFRTPGSKDNALVVSHAPSGWLYD